MHNAQRNRHKAQLNRHKAQKNRPLSQGQRNANKAISKTRYIVEQCFGAMKRLFGMVRASKLGTEEVNAQFTLRRCASTYSRRSTKLVGLTSLWEQSVRGDGSGEKR
jgi:IS5 family transposase